MFVICKEKQISYTVCVIKVYDIKVAGKEKIRLALAFLRQQSEGIAP